MSLTDQLLGLEDFLPRLSAVPPQVGLNLSEPQGVRLSNENNAFGLKT